MKKIVNALITPFDDNNHIDYQELDKLLALAKDNCNDALVVGSTTGEGTLLSQDEKIECFKYVLKHTSLPCIYPINQMSFEKAKEEIDLVKELNFDIFLIVTPFYIKPTQEGLFVYFKEPLALSDKFRITECRPKDQSPVHIVEELMRQMIPDDKNYHLHYRYKRGEAT